MLKANSTQAVAQRWLNAPHPSTTPQQSDGARGDGSSSQLSQSPSPSRLFYRGAAESRSHPTPGITGPRAPTPNSIHARTRPAGALRLPDFPRHTRQQACTHRRTWVDKARAVTQDPHARYTSRSVTQTNTRMTWSTGTAHSHTEQPPQAPRLSMRMGGDHRESHRGESAAGCLLPRTTTSRPTHGIVQPPSAMPTPATERRGAVRMVGSASALVVAAFFIYHHLGTSPVLKVGRRISCVAGARYQMPCVQHCSHSPAKFVLQGAEIIWPDGVVKNVLLEVLLRGMIIFFTLGFAVGFAVHAVLAVLKFELSLHDPQTQFARSVRMRNIQIDIRQKNTWHRSLPPRPRFGVIAARGCRDCLQCMK